jgi:hypothetical protein
MSLLECASLTKALVAAILFHNGAKGDRSHAEGRATRPLPWLDDLSVSCDRPPPSNELNP